MRKRFVFGMPRFLTPAISSLRDKWKLSMFLNHALFKDLSAKASSLASEGARPPTCVILFLSVSMTVLSPLGTTSPMFNVAI